MMKRHSYLIGIDGNEANVLSRVGVNQFAFGLLKALWNLKTKNSFVIYLSVPPISNLPKEKANWHYRIIGPAKLWTQWRLPLDLFGHVPRPDVFFSPSHYAPRFSPVPTVVSIMDLGFLKSREQFDRKDYLQLKNWTDYSVRQARKVVAISEATKSDVVKSYSVKPENVTVVYPGYERERFFPRKKAEVEKILDRYSIKQPYLLFLSSLKPSKNIERLVEAFGECVKKNFVSFDTKLVVAGKKAWLYEEVYRSVSERKLQKKVIFTGFFPEEDLPYLISGAMAFLMPSIFEGFGIPAVEAMASGVPVVVSRVASLPEVVGEAGIYVDPYNVEDIVKSLKFVSNLGTSQKAGLIKAGLRQANKFDWGKSATKLLKALEDAVQ